MFENVCTDLIHRSEWLTQNLLISIKVRFNLLSATHFYESNQQINFQKFEKIIFYFILFSHPYNVIKLKNNKTFS
jgi:hypothetical protein